MKDNTILEHKELSSTKRIAKNTIMLYFRQILIMLVSLYTVRVVLNVLGVEDYGIYNVVAGVVTMFSFLASTMATASQRYFSYDLGKDDMEHLKLTFSVTYQIYGILILLIVLLTESLGLWFVNSKLVIPPERMFAANCIYQFAIISFCFTLITTPYMACIIAHENMNVYAYVSIIEVSLKLGIVFLLKILPFDNLITYGLLLLIVSIINTTIYRVYCRMKFPECKFKALKDSKLKKEMIAYSGWNLFGCISSMIKTQGISSLLNIFFGPILNASQGIANSVRNAVNTFATNFSTAVWPQIVKSYAKNEYEETHGFVIFGCKITYFLNLFFIVPLSNCIPFVLNLWLGEIPDFSVVFIRLLLIEALIEAISLPMASANQATGKIALYQFFIGLSLIFNVPLSFILLKMFNRAEIVYIVGISCQTLVVIVRFVFLARIPSFKFTRYLTKLFIPVIIVTVASFILVHFLKFNSDKIIINLIQILSHFFITTIFILIIGLSKSERSKLFGLLKKKVLHK